jgi:hypothetical protein
MTVCYLDCALAIAELTRSAAAFVTYLPAPLVLLSDGIFQNVHIAPEAFNVSSAEFGSELQYWQNALPGSLKGQLASLSGAKVSNCV